MSESNSSEPAKQQDIFYTGDPERRCEKCGKSKPLEEFRVCTTRGKLCRIRTCFGCERGYKAERKKKPKGFDSAKRRNGKNKGYVLRRGQWSEMAKGQDNKCAVCFRSETRTSSNGEVRNLSVDHDHSTGKIRGLLCDICNRGLCLVERGDDPAFVHALVDRMFAYLARHAEESS
jgi:hypothetical protein